MRTYTQLTQEQRYQIYSLMKAGHIQTEIARLINVHKSTGGEYFLVAALGQPGAGALAEGTYRAGCIIPTAI
jgi:hypothetical protein